MISQLDPPMIHGQHRDLFARPQPEASGRRGPDRPHQRRTARSAATRVGVDLMVVAEVARSVEVFGDRYLNRIFTPHEIRSCRISRPGETPARYSAESLAARFAAKEATVKVLRPADARPEWRSIEVHRDRRGWCEIRLGGLAAAMADDAGLEELAVCMTHESMMAAAVVVGTRGSGKRRSGRLGPPAWREE
jgi:holo-[acyl-carrier protein] synthase